MTIGAAPPLQVSLNGFRIVLPFRPPAPALQSPPSPPDPPAPSGELTAQRPTMVWAKLLVGTAKTSFKLRVELPHHCCSPALGSSERGRDAHNIASFAHTSFNQMRFTVVSGPSPARSASAFEGKGPGPRRDVQSGNLLQDSQQFLVTDAVGKILLPLSSLRLARMPAPRLIWCRAPVFWLLGKVSKRAASES